MSEGHLSPQPDASVAAAVAKCEDALFRLQSYPAEAANLTVVKDVIKLLLQLGAPRSSTSGRSSRTGTPPPREEVARALLEALDCCSQLAMAFPTPPSVSDLEPEEEEGVTAPDASAFHPSSPSKDDAAADDAVVKGVDGDDNAAPAGDDNAAVEKAAADEEVVEDTGEGEEAAEGEADKEYEEDEGPAHLQPAVPAPVTFSPALLLRLAQALAELAHVKVVEYARQGRRRSRVRSASSTSSANSSRPTSPRNGSTGGRKSPFNSKLDYLKRESMRLQKQKHKQRQQHRQQKDRKESGAAEAADGAAPAQERRSRCGGGSTAGSMVSRPNQLWLYAHTLWTAVLLPHADPTASFTAKETQPCAAAGQEEPKDPVEPSRQPEIELLSVPAVRSRPASDGHLFAPTPTRRRGGSESHTGESPPMVTPRLISWEDTHNVHMQRFDPSQSKPVRAWARAHVEWAKYMHQAIENARKDNPQEARWIDKHLVQDIHSTYRVACELYRELFRIAKQQLRRQPEPPSGGPSAAAATAATAATVVAVAVDEEAGDEAMYVPSPAAALAAAAPAGPGQFRHPHPPGLERGGDEHSDDDDDDRSKVPEPAASGGSDDRYLPCREVLLEWAEAIDGLVDILGMFHVVGLGLLPKAERTFPQVKAFLSAYGVLARTGDPAMSVHPVLGLSLSQDKHLRELAIAFMSGLGHKEEVDPVLRASLTRKASVAELLAHSHAETLRGWLQKHLDYLAGTMDPCLDPGVFSLDNCMDHPNVLRNVLRFKAEYDLPFPHWDNMQGPPLRSPTRDSSRAASATHGKQARWRQLDLQRRVATESRVVFSQLRRANQMLAASRAAELVQTRNPHDLYTNWREIGEGGFGLVYSACSRLHDDNVVAIKRIPQSQSSAVKHEIATLSYAKHPNIVRYHETLAWDDHLWVVMGFCDGGSLQDLVQQAGPLSENNLAYVLNGMLQGVAFLHRKLLVHRDIKPDNVFMQLDGTVLLGDFGLCEPYQEALRYKETSLSGTSRYMAPEMIRKDGTDTKSDLWSVGALCLYCCEGAPPYQHHASISAMFLAGSGVPPELDDPMEWSPLFRHFLNCCLQCDPELRWSAEQLLDHEFLTAAASQKDVVRQFKHVFVHQALYESGMY